MMRRLHDAMDIPTVVFCVISFLVGYAAWLTSIVFCAANGMRPLLIAAATVFPVGVVHGIGLWFGGW
jgi:hypothetical protein